ncbi:MAG: valine--tRNA ligase [Verrucomicrobiota bacterium]
MKELAKAYEPQQVEDRLYAGWLKSGAYHADPASPKEKFSVVIPPPNVTGVLTMGHVLNNTIQDILCRHARLQGKEVLWLPGTDHAGLATQVAVEKALRKPAELPPTVRAKLESYGLPEGEPLTRQTLGRERLLELIEAWQQDRGGVIIKQLKKLGASCDWQRERFTMDADYVREVQERFVELYNQGYMYRGLKMVNWCPATLTAISNEEVIPTPQNSKLYYLRYEIAEEPGRFLEIATTRPETIMGDSGVAVHPDDDRYRDLIGKHAIRPFPRAELPIVGDTYIDREFGTGVLKVTPAHDHADFDIGRRHNLKIIDVMTKDGKINCPGVPELHGLERFAARQRAAELLGEKGALIREEDYRNNVGFSERGKVAIEPKLSEQWFLRYPRIDEALDVVNNPENKLIRFYPPHWEKTYSHWLENIQDWCVSRQTWYGHRLPVWYRKGHTAAQLASPGEDWDQDEDTMDTWASSWLWAYATMDPETRRAFYPTSVLVTGPDIIFLWVARMIVAGLEILPGVTEQQRDNIPFRDVYFTGLIRDAKGRKMSKSLGNSPDPLELIAKYGADGLRFGLMRIAPQGADIRYDEKQIEEGRNFCNKLWNAARFRALQGPIDPHADPHDAGTEKSVFACDILFQLGELNADVDRALEQYEFNTAAGRLYDFVWKSFCSRFLEAAKVDFLDPESPTRAGTLAVFDYVLSHVLRLLHPFAPFITEELWQELGFADGAGADGGSIQFAPWPTLRFGDLPQRTHFLEAESFYRLVDQGRVLRGEFEIPSKQALKFLLHASSELAPADLRVAASMLNASEIEVVPEKVKHCPVVFTPLGELYLPLEGVVDPVAETERLKKALAKVEKDIDVTGKKLANQQVIEKAPAEKVEGWRQHARELDAKRDRLREQLDYFAEQVSG